MSALSLRIVLVAMAVSLLGFYETHAQTEITPTVLEMAPTATSVIEPTVTATPNIEVLVLKAQLEQMRSTDSQLLDAVYWSLAFIGGFTLLLVGYNWVNNRWLYERDKVVIREELRSELQKDITMYKVALEEGLYEIVSDETKPLKSQLQAFLKDLRESENRTKLNFRGLEVELFLIRAQLAENSNNLNDARQLYEVAIYASREEAIFNRSNSISRGLEGLQRVLKKGLLVDREIAIHMRDFLRNIPNEHREEIRYIVELIKEALSKNNV